jgi:hypothetical protein
MEGSKTRTNKKRDAGERSEILRDLSQHSEKEIRIKIDAFDSAEQIAIACVKDNPSSDVLKWRIKNAVQNAYMQGHGMALKGFKDGIVETRIKDSKR